MPSKLQNPGELTDLEHNFCGVHLKIEITYFGIKIYGFIIVNVGFLINPPQTNLSQYKIQV